MLVRVGESLEASRMELPCQFIGHSVRGQIIVTHCIKFLRGYMLKLTSVNLVPKLLHLAEEYVDGVIIL